MGLPPHDEKVFPLEENANVDHALSKPLPMNETDIRAILAQMAQAMTTQAQAATIQSQAMTVQANREVAPRVYQQVSTMASRLRDFTRINPPTFYGSKVDEDSHEFLDEVYKVLYSTGVSSSEKAMLALYKLKDVAETWYVQWRDNRSLRGGPVTWEIFKAAFLERFFPRKMREEKVVEFINLHQGGRSVHEYSLEFIKLFKCRPSLIFDPRDQMSHLVSGVSEDLQDECHSAMLHENMNIFRLMGHARRVDEARSKQKSIDDKRARSYNGGSSKNRLDIQDKPRFKKRVSNSPFQVPKS